MSIQEVTLIFFSVMDGPFDIQGVWYFFEKKFVSLQEQNSKMSSTKLKIKVCFPGIIFVNNTEIIM